MKTIMVDDQPAMIEMFLKLAENIEDLDVVGCFTEPSKAIGYAENNEVDAAFIDIIMPETDGIRLAETLRSIKDDILIVFISAHDEYIRDYNRIGADDFIIKPYERKTLEVVTEKLKLLSKRQKKKVYIKTFGVFTVIKDGRAVKLRGKAKEILALLVTKRGREISNEEIFSTIWENREYSNANMGVCYNAFARLRKSLEEAGLEDLLVSTTRGKMLDTSLFDCDYYEWLDGKRNLFLGEFMSEYTWGEYILADMIRINENF